MATNENAVSARRKLTLMNVARLHDAPICIGEEKDAKRTFIDRSGVTVTCESREREDGVEEMLVQRFPAEKLTNLIWGSFGAGFRS